MLDSFDPNTWGIATHEFRIYGDDNASVWSVVDEVDYQWCLQWQWSVKFSKRGKKFYLRRNTQSGFGREGRTRHTQFLHTEIMERTGIERPSEMHTLVDHWDGDGMNCRRANLRWATHQMNCINRNGSAFKQQVLYG